MTHIRDITMTTPGATVSRTLTAIAVLLALSAVPGCGWFGPPTAELTGRVTFEGKPAEGLALRFTPEDDGPAAGKPRPPAFATTDEEGRYRAIRFGRNLSGAAVGRNRVRILPSDTSSVPVDPVYGGNSPLVADVGPGATVFDIELVAKPVPATKPGK